MPNPLLNKKIFVKKNSFLSFLLKITLWRPRLSHFLMAFGCLLISVRVNRVMDDSAFSSTHITVGVGKEAQADEHPKPEEEKKDDSQKVGQEAEHDKKDHHPEKEDKPKSKDSVSKGKEGVEAISENILDFDPLTADENQMKVLNALSGNRKIVEKETEDLKKQKSLMDVSEKKIAQKLSELEALKNTLEQKAKTISKEEQDNITRMVTIYEAMKPGAAAIIFNKLDLSILIQLIKNMNQKKFSLVLAAMEPSKAQILTTEMLPKPDYSAQPVSPEFNTKASGNLKG